MIYKFNKEQYELVKKHVIEFYEGKNDIVFDEHNYFVTVKNSDISEFQLAADDAIIEYGMENQDCLTDLGCKLQFLYDEIYCQTKNHN